jgi:hypothetical protein
MGSSDGRQGAASPQAPATSAPLSAEDAERFASVLKPMWELDSAPQPAAPVALAPPSAPSSRPKVAVPVVPVVTVKPRSTAVNGTAPFPSIISPAASRDSSHEFDDLAQLPRGPSAAPDAVPVAEAAPPETPNAVAVQAHLPPRRQQISEPRASVEVDSPPPQTVSAPYVEPAAADVAVAQASFAGPTMEQLRARAARSQPTLVLNKDEIAGFPGRRSRAPLFFGIGALALILGGAAMFLLNGGRASSAPPLALAAKTAPGATSAAAASAGGMAIPPPAPVETPDPTPADSAPSAQLAVGATPTPAATPVAAPAPAPVVATPAPARGAPVTASNTPVSLGGGAPTKGAGAKPAPKPAKKASGGIVRASPF